MSAKQTIADKQFIAKVLFTREHFEQKIVAKKVGISEATMSKWVKDFGWKDLRNKMLLVKDEQMSSLYEELDEIKNFIKQKPSGQRFADTKIADIRIKTTTAIKNLETELGIEEAVEVGMKAIKLAQKTEPIEKVLWLTDFWHGFLQTIHKGK